jgi:hypothetical protein
MVLPSGAVLFATIVRRFATMHRKIIITAIAGVYYLCSAYALYIFGAEILLTSVVLFGIPAYFLARFSMAPTPVLVSVTLLGVSLAFVLEGVAHTSGLWYTVGVDELRIFSLVPFEALVAMVLQVLFLSLVYEALFDDGVYTSLSAYKRYNVFGGIMVGVLLAVFAYSLLDTVLVGSDIYMLLNGALLGVCFISLALYRAFTIQFLDRLVFFTGVAMIPLMVNLGISVVNVHKVFANYNEYAYTFLFLGEIIPLEEVVLALTIPFFVATIYEIYLDNTA